MTEETLGSRIADARKKCKLTQEDLAVHLGVTAQAVSKWENDISCPDITLLPKLSSIFGISIDELLSGRKIEIVEASDEENRKPFEKLILYLRFFGSDGVRIAAKIPMPLVKIAIEDGNSKGYINISDEKSGKKEAFGSRVDLRGVLELVEAGKLGKLLEFESSDGDRAEVYVE
ncbi:MAG: helix-turn-helix domain-containing protein [Clostridia bacterium]|nr:helix-turn-helix domain-containing protein [Clostridia bacterium]